MALIARRMLAAWSKLREQVTAFDKAVRTEVKQNRECRLLMSVPGIGPITVLAYVSAIENPDRFRRSRLVGAHLGLTPRQYQSGDVDRSGHISKCGDTLARLCLYNDLTEEMRLENGSELARTFFTSAVLVGAAMCSAYECGSRDRWPECPPRIKVPVNRTHSTMLWPLWVVLIAGSTGSALRAVRPPNLHITPDARCDLVKPRARLVPYSVRPSIPTRHGGSFWKNVRT